VVFEEYFVAVRLVHHLHDDQPHDHQDGDGNG
jgi:hypothetical protein